MASDHEPERCRECGRRTRPRWLPGLPSPHLPRWVFLFAGIAFGAIGAAASASIGPSTSSSEGPAATARVTTTSVEPSDGGAGSGTSSAPTTDAPGSTLAQVLPPTSVADPVPTTVATTVPIIGPPSTPVGANVAVTVTTTTTTTTTTTAPASTPVAAPAATVATTDASVPGT